MVSARRARAAGYQGAATYVFSADPAPRDAPYEEHTQADDPWASFSVLRRLPIPSSVFETITSRAPVATLALFPAIGRACITVENRVYLWDYANGQTAFEYHQLPDDEVVLSVGLIPAKPNVFIPEIKHVLVLSTGPNALEGKRVSLLGVELTSRPGSSSGVKLYETAMSANTNGVAMRDIQGTDGGRVFCVGSDHCVYELVYQANEGWFSSRCYLYNVTLPRLSNLVPSFFKSEKKLNFLTIDSQRNLLYVLRQGDQIDVYSLPSKDSSRAPVHTGSMYGVTHQAGLLHSQQEVGQIVWLGATEADARTNVCLVAVTEKGYRIYFDDFQRRSWAQLAVRIPPGAPRPPSTMPLLGGLRLNAPPQTSTLRKATSALYSNGLLLEAFTSPDAGSQLYGISTGTTAAAYAASGVAGSAWQESATLISLGQGASAPVLAEVDAAAARRRVSEANGATTRPCAAENLGAPRVFLVLDSNGLTEVVERRPADILASLLSGSVGGGNAASTAPPILDFFNRYGSIEASMTALAIAAGNSNLVTLPGHLGALDLRSLSDQVQAQAIRVFFGPLGSWPADSRMPTTLVSSKSSRYEALAYYLACLVRAIWAQKLVPEGWLETKPKTVPNPLVSQGLLTAALRELGPLVAFMQRHSQLFELGPTNDAPLVPNAASQQSERQDFERLRALAERASEACQFVLFLADHNLATIVQSVSSEVRAKLQSLRFGDLVSSAEGRNVANELVNALIESQSGARASVDAIADALQVRCASFCSADDVRRYKASESLRNAVETDLLLRQEHTAASAPDDDRRRAIDEDLQLSLRLLLASAAQLPLEKLTQVCTTYAQLKFTRGVITLALACARASDVAGAAIAYRADGCPEETSSRRTVYEQRRAMYERVLDALQALDTELDAASNALAGSKDAATRARLEQVEGQRAEAYALATQSDDPLFHEELYTWLIERGLTSQLLELRTPFLEEFLQGTPVLLGGAPYEVYVRRLRDLLWQLHVRNGAFFAAAQTLDELAHADVFALRLHERIEYLALAVGNAKSVRPAAHEAQEVIAFATQVEEDLEVAQVQAKILGALLPMDTLDLDDEERARRSAVLAALDSELLDITALYKEAAQPFALLEQQLLILHTAQYQDANLVADIWEALFAREHNASDAEHAHQAIAALVTDMYARLGASEIACPVDLLLARLEQYAYDTSMAIAGSATPSVLNWGSFAALNASPIAIGWAPLVLLQAGAPPESIFDVLQALVATAPPPWNTTAGLGFLLPDAAAYLAQWLSEALTAPDSRAIYFPAHRVDEAANDYVLKLNTRKFQRPDDDLDRRVEQLHTVLQRIQRAF